MQKIILYYKFAPIVDPEAVRLWQHTLAESLGLKGRVIVSPQGINGTLGGDIEDVKRYVKKTKQFGPFKGIEFKWSDGQGDDFPRLSVKTKPELVAFDAAHEIVVNEHGVVGGGKHLSPEAVHRLVAERGDEVVFFDGRNKHEAAIGKFKDAVVPDVETSRDFVQELDDPKYDELKNKAVVTYCTGGIRCEVLSSLMKQRGFNEVYQIDGGIVKYGERYKDTGLWEGSLYVFDGREHTTFSDSAVTIAACTHCGTATNQYINCEQAGCHKQILLCEDCQQLPAQRYHEVSCAKLATV